MPASPPFPDPFRVSRVDRGAVDLLAPGGRARASYAVPLAPCVGDWVLLRAGAADLPAVAEVLPRQTALVRGTAHGSAESQVLAANVDVVLVVHPLSSAPRAGRIERLVAVAWDSGARPVVLLTKADLAADAELLREEVAALTPGVDVHAVSAVTQGGLDALAPYLAPGRCAALLGASGAGKSTLVNRLLGHEQLATQAVRGDGKGRHTTSHRELLELPGGGLLIDTPGLRGLALFTAEEGIERTFADVEALTAECRFSDCAHRTEPGCAVLAAVDDGRLPLRRLESWRKLQREARRMAARVDHRLRAEERARIRAFSRQVRDLPSRP